MSVSHRRLFIGLMSGTSVDAADAVLLAINPAEPNPREAVHPGTAVFETLASASIPFPEALRRSIQALQSPGNDELDRAAMVSLELAELYAQASLTVMSQAGCTARHIQAIGAHGQTVRHRPHLGFTIQLLNAARLAERTGIAVIHDFRSADVAAGGQGAPLVPAFHAQAFGDATQARAIVNIGGIANVSFLPAAIDPKPPQVTGHDTGPGNTLLDQWYERHQAGAFDAAGAWAAGGTCHPELLNAMLADPYFQRPAPKSTGRDDFNLTWLEHHLDRHASSAGAHLSAQDVQATLAQLTATTISHACLNEQPSQIFVCGGGVFNLDLIGRIKRQLPGCTIRSTATLGIDPMAVEAAAFAWLAYRRLERLPGNLAAVTGAAGGRVLGSITDPLGRLDI